MTRDEVLAQLEQVDRLIAAENYSDAEDLLRDLLREEVAEKDLFVRSNILRRLSDVLGRRLKATEALPLAEEAIACLERLIVQQGHERRETSEARVKAIANVGIVWYRLDNYSAALEHLNQAMKLQDELGMKVDAARNRANIGLIYWKIDDYPRALENMNNALVLQEELGMKVEVAKVLGNIGGVYWNLSDYSRALDYLYRSLALYEELGMTQELAGKISDIGVVHRSLGDYPRALEHLSRALQLEEKGGKKDGIARVCGNMGLVYQNLAEFPLALEYMSRALATHEELGLKAEAARTIGNMGAVLHLLGDYPRALEYMLRALALHDEIGMRADVARVSGKIGSLYANKNYAGYDVEKAEEYLLGAVALSEQLGTRDEQYENHKLLSDLYKQEARWEECQFHFERFHELKETVKSEEAQKKAAQIDLQKRIADMEQRRSVERAAAEATTALLHRVLPPSIATRLVQGEKVADYFNQISILFADIVGFTPIAARMPAKAVLAFLNYVFGEFDRIIERHGCQKIKTIGDGYMAVSGAPIACEDHAERLALAALELMNDIALPDEVTKQLPSGASFDLRIGLHSGSAYAGIVGEKAFSYDVYSDAVNLAARMESHGIAGRIHVSEEFAIHLQNRQATTRDNSPVFVFEERGEMDIKGKGTMRTYFLEKAL